MTKKQETQRGITLVALVITIVILIILSTVTIGAVFGDNGLIKKAEYAKDLSANSTKYEEESMTNLAVYMNELLGEGSAGGKTLVQAFKEGELEVGDYVNYKPEAHDPITVGTNETGYTDSKGISKGTDQTFTQDANTTWRILGLSEDGKHLLLTSGSPIKKDGEDPYLVLESAAGAANCVQVLDKVSSLYHNSTLADETRSMKIEDIERVLGGVTVEYPQENPKTKASSSAGKVYLNVDKSKTNIGDTTSYPSYTYEEGDYKLINPPIKATAGEKVNAYAYMFQYNYEVYKELGVNISQKAYDMLFADTTEDSNYAKSYWLASPGVYAYSSYAYFGPGFVYSGVAASGGYGLFGSGGYWHARGLAVRPVVVLKSNVTVEQVQKIDDQTETKWNTTGGNTYGSGRLDRGRCSIK